MSVRINTVGFAGKTLEDFVELLRGAGVSKVIDIRLRPDTQLSAYARQRDLRYFLGHYEGIAYEHDLELAPTPEILDEYRATKDWNTYVAGFSRLMREREMSDALQRAIAGHESVALLCSEAKPEKCHRRLLAERYVDCHPGTAVIHL